MSIFKKLEKFLSLFGVLVDLTKNMPDYVPIPPMIYDCSITVLFITKLRCLENHHSYLPVISTPLKPSNYLLLHGAWA